MSALLKASEVAQVLRISKSSVHRMLERGEIPHLRVGSEPRIPEAALRAYILAHWVGGTVDADVIEEILGTAAPEPEDDAVVTELPRRAGGPQ